MDQYTRTTILERLLKRARDVPSPNWPALSDCLEWIGYRTSDGYGRITIDGKSGQYIHRVAWELFYGSIPDGLYVLHRCDNPPCFFYEHLFLGTQKDNIIDMRDKQRLLRYGTTEKDSEKCPSGHLYSENAYINTQGSWICRTCRKDIKERATVKYRDGDARARLLQRLNID